jgi:uncharacterized protein (DUF305 family)
MMSSRTRAPFAALLAAALAACGGATRTAAQTPHAHGVPRSDSAALAQARPDASRYPWTEADAHFMTAMIGHHAQAIQMARLAPTHGVRPAVQTLADRIINAQQDEIATMQTWLRDRGQPVPDAHDHAMHGAAGHEMMPGMLTPEQMAQLEQAQGPEFERLFLTFMIQHHRGATEMVTRLFGTQGAAQDETVFKFASDVNVDQTTEIARMQRMLADLLFGAPSP